MVRSRNKVSAKLDELKQKAGRLSVAERAELALVLIQSLDAGVDDDVDEAWRLEAELRAGQIDRGEVQPVPGDEVIARVRRQLR